MRGGWRIFVGGTLAVALAGGVVRAEGEDDPGAPASGPYAVVVAPELTLYDQARTTALPVIVVYPTLEPSGVDRRPLIVFSHGAGGSGGKVLDLPRFWASHGFVVLVPTHADSVSRTGQGLRGLRAALEKVRQPFVEFADRPADVRFLLDSLDTVLAEVPALADRVDRQAIGVGGHSLGAWTAQVIGGAKVDLTEHERGRSLADPRVRAVCGLSPQGPGRMGLTESSWGDFGRPLLTVTGSRDGGAGNEGPDWRKEPFLRALGGDKYHCFIQGAAHSSFTKDPKGARAEQSPDDRPPRPGRLTPDPAAERRGLLGRLLGDPDLRLAEADDGVRQQFIRRLGRTLERFEERDVKGLEGGVLDELRTLVQYGEAGEWERADALRDLLLERSTPTTGKTPSPAQIFGYTASVTLRFWQAHLQGDATAKSWLAGPALRTASDGAATLERR